MANCAPILCFLSIIFTKITFLNGMRENGGGSVGGQQEGWQNVDDANRHRQIASGQHWQQHNGGIEMNQGMAPEIYSDGKTTQMNANGGGTRARPSPRIINEPAGNIEKIVNKRKFKEIVEQLTSNNSDVNRQKEIEKLYQNEKQNGVFQNGQKWHRANARGNKEKAAKKRPSTGAGSKGRPRPAEKVQNIIYTNTADFKQLVQEKTGGTNQSSQNVPQQNGNPLGNNIEKMRMQHKGPAVVSEIIDLADTPPSSDSASSNDGHWASELEQILMEKDRGGDNLDSIGGTNSHHQTHHPTNSALAPQRDHSTNLAAFSHSANSNGPRWASDELEAFLRGVDLHNPAANPAATTNFQHPSPAGHHQPGRPAAVDGSNSASSETWSQPNTSPSFPNSATSKDGGHLADLHAFLMADDDVLDRADNAIVANSPQQNQGLHLQNPAIPQYHHSIATGRMVWGEMPSLNTGHLTNAISTATGGIAPSTPPNYPQASPWEHGHFESAQRGHHFQVPSIPQHGIPSAQQGTPVGGRHPFPPVAPSKGGILDSAGVSPSSSSSPDSLAIHHSAQMPSSPDYLQAWQYEQFKIGQDQGGHSQLPTSSQRGTLTVEHRPIFAVASKRGDPPAEVPPSKSSHFHRPNSANNAAVDDNFDPNLNAILMEHGGHYLENAKTNGYGHNYASDRSSLVKSEHRRHKMVVDSGHWWP